MNVDADTLSRWRQLVRRGAFYCKHEDTGEELRALEEELHQAWLGELWRSAPPAPPTESDLVHAPFEETDP